MTPPALANRGRDVIWYSLGWIILVGVFGYAVWQVLEWILLTSPAKEAASPEPERDAPGGNLTVTRAAS